MQITERREGSILVIAVEGRLDNAGSDIFRETALCRIQEGARSLIVDFSKTDFIASMGIRALFIPAQELARVKGRIVLSGLNAELKNLFLIGGLLDLFQVFENVDKAVADTKW
jgi:anti-sigma B factor antagonist